MKFNFYSKIPLLYFIILDIIIINIFEIIGVYIIFQITKKAHWSTISREGIHKYFKDNDLASTRQRSTY